MKFIISLIFFIMLSGCNNDGSESAANTVESPPPSSSSIIAGVYKDTPTSDPLTVSLDQTVMINLENGEYFILRGRLGNPPPFGGKTPVIAEVFHGNSNQTGESITSPDLRYFDLARAFVGTGTLEATHSNNASVISGSMSHSVSEESIPEPKPFNPFGIWGHLSGLSVTRDGTASAIPNFENVAGNYSGTALTQSGDEVVTIAISNSGEIFATGAETGCTLTGQLTSVIGGYRAQITFGGAPCTDYPGQTLNGLVLRTHGFLIATILDQNRSGGVFFTAPAP